MAGETVPRIGAAKFKAQCLRILDQLSPQGIVVTKHGRPVARVLPYGTSPVSWIGRLAGQIEVKGDLFSTGLEWEASAPPVDVDPC